MAKRRAEESLDDMRKKLCTENKLMACDHEFVSLGMCYCMECHTDLMGPLESRDSDFRREIEQLKADNARINAQIAVETSARYDLVIERLTQSEAKTRSYRQKYQRLLSIRQMRGVLENLAREADKESDISPTLDTHYSIEIGNLYRNLSTRHVHYPDGVIPAGDIFILTSVDGPHGRVKVDVSKFREYVQHVCGQDRVITSIDSEL